MYMSIHVEKTRFNFNTLTMEATVKAKALLRIVNYMNISRRKKLMNVFFSLSNLTITLLFGCLITVPPLFRTLLLHIY